MDLRFSNLPLDYLNGVLPTAQFGSESVISLGSSVSSLDGKLRVNTDYGALSTALVVRPFNDNGTWVNQLKLSELQPIPASPSLDAIPRNATGGTLLHTHTIPSDALNLSVLSLRQAYAAQKYKEIQLANDVDFASQIEAHFGVKPKHADDTSYFIGGSSSMIDINPIVNQNLSGDGQANYKASPIGNGSSKIKFTADTNGSIVTGKQIGRAHV